MSLASSWGDCWSSSEPNSCGIGASAAAGASRRATGSVVLAIVLIAAERGFLEALLFGILAGCVIFAVDVSRIRVIRHQFGLDERASSVIRSTAESALLAEHGAQVQVLELSGYLFFGSAYSVQERVARLVTGSKPREVIFDFSGVTGIDSSAGACFAKIRDVLRQNGARQVIAALSPAAANVMSASSGLDDGVGRHDPSRQGSRGSRGDAAGGACRVLRQPAIADRLARRSAWLGRVRGRTLRSLDAGTARRRLLPLPAGRPNRQSDLCRTGARHGHLGKTGAIIAARAGVRTPHPGWRDRLFLDAPRSASLLAAPDAVVWVLSRGKFEDLKKTRPENLSALFVYIIRLQSERLTFANRQIVALQR